MLQALEQLARELEQAGQFERALSYAVRAANLDPLREETHRTVMRLHAVMAAPWAALRHYDDLIQDWLAGRFKILRPGPALPP